MSTALAADLDHRNNLREYIHQTEMFSKMLANMLLMLLYAKSRSFFSKPSRKLEYLLFNWIRSKCENCLDYLDACKGH